ncbi:hypothetical protein OIV83_005980 [Microbotryomycetes sp. JL201]|nr:hypothetical protein OIV83_005980 [Microbotryomycetes sp. JL201]
MPSMPQLGLRQLTPRASTSASVAKNVARPARVTVQQQQRRSVHQRVPLPYEIDNGLQPFMSAQALRTTAVDWQQGVLSRLNELVQGTELENLSVYQTVIQAAADPTKALVFNHASEALNNSFFLSTLSPTPSQPTVNSKFSEAIAKSRLQSFAGLISHFSAHVAGLHPSSGAYVWLVTDTNENLGVVGTYAGGTPLVRGRMQVGGSKQVLGEPVSASAEEGSQDGSKAGWNAVTRERKTPAFELRPQTKSLFSDVVELSRGTDGTRLYPLACVSVHPHCYLQDYGVWGREQYVKNWWSAVDWRKVEQAYEGLVQRSNKA